MPRILGIFLALSVLSHDRDLHRHLQGHSTLLRHGRAPGRRRGDPGTPEPGAGV